ncbi:MULTISPECIES: 50S ribosomal protein L25/general stress protein Ctc [unclassified Streptomyces]|uniref:50S ribosomal protein L25/general stress protein Ctc n=1 Tax=unclassified Streptomyces TaxID=2593676 RepID=UPI000B1403C9|nr:MULTISPECIES: 50S ribosomal protein L25/general stress protein Ctc [unclassified Streptomyces]MCX5147337.1 50S ribosomal protein L25/general stress protein Ctc [Streptomyces sp. NBC_00320]WSN50463.1 50S ribosomal protein L25/general stress protein Ctc [Streptomyces sp. NBC_01296]WSW60086.1 50S ribosomal protein L25/general stress protein Ctc [Streptomyces sp. NBC_00998]
MSEVKISAQLRNTFGKGSARQARRDAMVPGVIYGHGNEPKHVNVEGHALALALRTPNVLLSLDIAGEGTELVIPKAVQKHPLKRSISHVDFLIVKKGEKVTVEVAVVTEGELAAGSNMLETLLNTITVEAEATHIPTEVTVSIAGLEAGASIHAKDLVLPAGTTLAVDGDTAVLQVVAPQAEEPTAEAAEGAEA